MLKILFGAVVGTSLMTIFSYITAEVTEKQFKEPVLLNCLVAQSPHLRIAESSKSLTGWILHFGMGLFFLVIYYFLWLYTFIEPNVLHGASLGLISGIVGIIIWELIFIIHSNPPEIDLKEYYLHLMIAHFIFGMGAVAGYNLL